MIRPSEYNIYIEIGRDYTQTFNFQDENSVAIDLSGYSAKAELRPSYNSDELLATFTTSISGTAGQVTVSLSHTTTSGLSLDNTIGLGSTTSSRNAVWDLMLTDTLGYKYNYIKGTATIEGTATLAG